MYAESGHHLKRGVANIEGQELLTGVIMVWRNSYIRNHCED